MIDLIPFAVLLPGTVFNNLDTAALRDTQTPEQKSCINEGRSLFLSAMATLTYRERTAVVMYFDLEGLTPHKTTYEEIARQFGVTRESIRKIIQHALAKLKNPNTVELRYAALAYGFDSEELRDHDKNWYVSEGFESIEAIPFTTKTHQRAESQQLRIKSLLDPATVALETRRQREKERLHKKRASRRRRRARERERERMWEMWEQSQQPVT